MFGARHRYVAGALGGIALVGGSIGGVQRIAEHAGAAAPATLTGSAATGCSVRGAVTHCVRPGAPPRVDPTAETAPYRDGVYAVTGHYLTPGGSETIGVSVTLALGAIVQADVQVEATSPTARQFQQQFASRYAGKVVARDLSAVSVTRVAGASLTSSGFNDAITQIRAAARA